MHSEQVPDLYAVMHLAPDCTEDEIKAQWRHFARVFHPDANAGDPWYEEEFKKLEAAYEVLGHPDRRAEYDQARVFMAPVAQEYEKMPASHVVYDDRHGAEPYRGAIADESPAVATRRTRGVVAALLIVFVLMVVSIIRAVHGEHPAVPESEQVIEGSTIVQPQYVPALDPQILAQQEGLQARLNAVRPAIEGLIGNGQRTLSLMDSQDKRDAIAKLGWTPPVERQCDEAAIRADIGELQFRSADLEQQIGQMGTAAGANPDTIRQDLDAITLPRQPLANDITLAERDLRHEAGAPR